MPGAKVLVIDDERDVTRAVSLTITLQEPTWQVLTAHTGEQGLELLDEHSPDAVLLDLQIPDLHGFDVLQRIRLFSDVPVIILTVRDDELDKVRGLQLGADDYVVKPFGHLELLARLRSVLRRAAGFAGPSEPPFILGDLQIDWNQRRVFLRGEHVRLTSTEYRLLERLARNAGRAAKTAYVDASSGQRLSYGELTEQAHRLAQALQQVAVVVDSGQRIAMGLLLHLGMVARVAQRQGSLGGHVGQ